MKPVVRVGIAFNAGSPQFFSSLALWQASKQARQSPLRTNFSGSFFFIPQSAPSLI
jgi:hypothetical protein